MKYNSTFSAILISGLIISACSSKKSNDSTGVSALLQKNIIPVR
jgi:hypothetical protein